MDAGMGGHVGAQDGGHDDLSDRGRDCKPDMARLGARDAFDGGDGAVEMREFASGLGEDQLAQRREAGLARAFKEWRTDMVLELAQHH